MKKRLVYLLFIILSGVSAFAQTQSGYVKTKGRLDSKGQLIPGTRIGGAAITLTGGHSTVADANGDFNLTVPDKKYYLKNVQKQGYVLVDPEVLQKQYVQSANPLVITMERPQQQMQDQIEAQKKIEATLRKQLLQREQELEALKEAQKITEDEFYQKMQQLYDEKITENIVKEMSKRYSEIDYDLVDSFQRQFSTYILDGDLRRADSLLKTKGDLSDDVRELQQLKTANAVEREALERRRARLDTSIAYAQWLMEDIAMRCYNKAEIFKMRYIYDSAAYYLELRAGLDLTNVDWQLDAGEFLVNIAEYKKADLYYNKACRVFTQSNMNTEDPLLARVYDCMGDLDKTLGDWLNACMDYQRARFIREGLYEKDHIEIAYSKMKWGWCYLHYSFEYTDALNYFKDALGIFVSNLGERHPNTALCNRLVGFTYTLLHNDSVALQYIQKSLSVLSSCYGDMHPEVATCYKYMGDVYLSMKNYSDALQCFQKALDIRISIYREDNPKVADVYDRIAEVYSRMKEEDNAIQYRRKSLEIWDNVYNRNERPFYGSVFNFDDYVNSDQERFRSLPSFLRNNIVMVDDYSGKMLADHLFEMGRRYESLFKDYAKAIVRYQEAYYMYRHCGISMREKDVLQHIRSLKKSMDSEVVYVGIVDNKTFEGPAKRQGMNGEYIILEYEDWTIDSTALLFDEVKKTKNHNDKSLLVMKDGVVSHYLFDFHEDMRIVSRIKGKTEKKQILEMYHQWKRQLQQCQRDIESLFNRCAFTGEECFQTLQNYYAEHKIKEELSCVCNIYAGKLCYRYFEEYEDNNQPDKAAYFLELRAELDTTNELWQRQAAETILENHADYFNKAMLYYQRALRQAEIKYGKNSSTVAECYRSIGKLYHEKGENDKALECFQHLVAIHQSIYGNNHLITKYSMRQMRTIMIHIVVLNTDSMKQYVFTATTVDGETPAKAQGLSGEYVMLEFGDWSIDSTSSLFDVNKEMKGKPKTILIMKDDIISEHYFENSIGVQIDLKQVGEEGKERIKKLYHQWKREH